jgi:hypothetical protein
MQPLPKILALSDKVYRKMLRLYPEPHRRGFGGQMAQLFRDQCRDAWAHGRYGGLAKLWLRTLPDLGKTSVIEQISQIERNNIMKYLNTKHTPTLLLFVGLLLALLSFAPFIGMRAHGLFMLLALTSTLAIFAKACVEFIRPANEYPWVLLRTFILMFLYAIILPAWAKMKLLGAAAPPPGHDPFGMVLMICLFANPLVTVIKILQFFLQRRKS